MTVKPLNMVTWPLIYSEFSHGWMAMFHGYVSLPEGRAPILFCGSLHVMPYNMSLLTVSAMLQENGKWCVGPLKQTSPCPSGVDCFGGPPIDCEVRRSVGWR